LISKCTRMFKKVKTRKVQGEATEEDTEGTK